MMHAGSLTIVGAGIQFKGHLTLEARSHIEQADKVLYALTDPASMVWITQLNPTAESFSDYLDGQPRRDAYRAWVEQMLAPVRQDKKVCAVFYGHPGVCVPPAHEAIRQARREGFVAMMLPGLSAEDCLFADLDVDPIEHGYQSFEATDFLIRPRAFDTSCALILRQIGTIGETIYQKKGADYRRGLRVLTETLTAHYGADHEIVVYEAARLPVMRPIIERVPLAGLPEARITQISTLYVPPKASAPVNASMLDRLGIPRSQGYTFFFDSAAVAGLKPEAAE